MQTERALAPAPPPGFRKPIPFPVKVDAVIRQAARCKACGELLVSYRDTQFDHVPAVHLRTWDPVAEDVIPSSNDPDAIHAKHKDCHAVKTTGRKGESRLNAVHGDVAEVAKLKRLTKSEIAFRQRLLAKGEPEPEPDDAQPKPRSRWPKRPFNRSAQRGSTTAGSEEGASGHGGQSLH